jgi:uncharacterized protein YacL (UPF0231 family)
MAEKKMLVYRKSEVEMAARPLDEVETAVRERDDIETAAFAIGQDQTLWTDEDEHVHGLSDAEEIFGADDDV